MANRGSQRASNVGYYWRNRIDEINRVRRRQDSTLVFLRQLRARPCFDCGKALKPYQMDFDHREPRLKSFQLTAGRAMAAWRIQAALLDRLRDVACADC